MRRWQAFRVKGGSVSLRIDTRVPVAALGLALLTVAVLVINLGLGEFPIAPLQVVRALLGVGEGGQHYIVTGLRLPRALVAAAVGMGLGASGAILQALTRNPLAAPEIVGVTAGANLAAVTVIVLIPSLPVAILPVAAFAGALAACAVVYLLAWRRGSHATRLLLVGIGVSAAAHAVVLSVVVTAPIFAVLQAVVWITGSVYASGWAEVQAIMVSLAVLLPAAMVLARRLDALQLGDHVAGGLGSRINVDRGLLLLVGIALAAASVAVAGPITFVGLLAPHIARRLVGPSAAGLIIVAAATGAAIVIVADTLGRTVFAPIDVPAGVITPIVGVPYLIAVLYRTQRMEVAK
jgi:iron complex transport system permease protein